jgi:choline-glycine betaine transporter
VTTAGWIFMLTSVGFVWGLMIWCFSKVLTSAKTIQKPPDSLGG